MRESEKPAIGDPPEIANAGRRLDSAAGRRWANMELICRDRSSFPDKIEGRGKSGIKRTPEKIAFFVSDPNFTPHLQSPGNKERSKFVQKATRCCPRRGRI